MIKGIKDPLGVVAQAERDADAAPHSGDFKYPALVVGLLVAAVVSACAVFVGLFL